jgi:hypothetical protein
MGTISDWGHIDGRTGASWRVGSAKEQGGATFSPHQRAYGPLGGKSLAVVYMVLLSPNHVLPSQPFSASRIKRLVIRKKSGISKIL